MKVMEADTHQKPETKPETRQESKPEPKPENAFTQSIDISFSKEDLLEAFSVSQAALEIKGDKGPVSISNEQIKKGDLILDTYEVCSDAVHGGMGSVWCVHHKGWDVDLAMKRPQPGFFAEGSKKRKTDFILECENWINLGLHPNIVSCYYVREIGGVPTIFSEWMDGGSLKDCIRSGSLYKGTEEEVQERILDLAIQAARGLSYSHDNGLIHQDVKPGNLLVKKDWELKAADFGLAKASSQLEDTEDGMLHPTGYTPEYCPKEQADGAPPETWMDVYAWALTVLEMYAGRRLWDTGREAGENWETYTGLCRFRLPQEMNDLLAACVKGRVNAFTGILPRLMDIYALIAKSSYPRPASREAPDTAGSLNNRALSFLDLGKREQAEALWGEALRKDPLHAQARFNRELSLVRSGKKMDFQGIEELGKYPETAGEYKAAMIREFGGEKAQSPFLDDAHEHKCFDGDARAAVLQGNTIWFGMRYHYSPLLMQFPIGADEAIYIDRLPSIREKKDIVWHIALHPDVRTAAFWIGEHTVCLYDIAKKQITAQTELPEELKPEHEDPPDTETVFFKFSSDGRFLLLGNVQAYKKRSLVLDADTLRVVEDLPCGLPGAFSSCLILGNPEKENDAAKDWRSHPALTGFDPHVIAIDPEQNVLYEERYTDYGHRFFVKDFSSGKVQFTVDGGCLNDPFAHWKYLLGEDGRSIVAWRGGPDVTHWIEAELPLPASGADAASWQLSRLRSFDESTEDAERIRALQMRFSLLMEQKDYAGAIGVHENLQEIPAYPMSDEAGRNEEALRKVAKIKGIRTIRALGETEDVPAGIRAQLKEERPSFLPDYVTRFCRRGDRYYAFNFMLDCEVYDPDGRLLTKPIRRRSPKQEPDDYHCPQFCDLDATGQYLLYALKAGEDPYGKKQTFGIYLRDLHAVQKISLFRPKDTLTQMQPKREHCFLPDGTIVESWDFGYLRYAANGHTLLQKISVTCEGSGMSGEFVEKETSIELENEKRWIVCQNTAYYTEINDTGCYYSIFDAEEGTLLYHWYSRSRNLYCLLPGGRFVCTWGRKGISVRDLYTGEETEADKYTPGGGFYALPDSRMLYLIQEDGKACAYEMEFVYEA